MRRRIIAGNWKMNKGVDASAALAADIAARVSEFANGVDLVLCPTFLALNKVAEAVRGSGIGVGAQDCYYEGEGAFTGEVNPVLIKDAGASYCIIGHSERRALLNETDRAVNLKAKALLNAGLTPIICVGETLEEKQAEDTLGVVSGQVLRALAGISADDAAKCVIAYEPVWAIGTGLNATAEAAQTVCAAIRAAIRASHGDDTAGKVRIQYGGSVKGDNIGSLMAEPDIDGALVGGASLKPDDFARIAAASAK